jgi:hypothetical protein
VAGARQLSIGFLDLLCRCRLGDAEHFIGIHVHQRLSESCWPMALPENPRICLASFAMLMLAATLIQINASREARL